MRLGPEMSLGKEARKIPTSRIKVLMREAKQWSTGHITVPNVAKKLFRFLQTSKRRKYSLAAIVVLNGH